MPHIATERWCVSVHVLSGLVSAEELFPRSRRGRCVLSGPVDSIRIALQLAEQRSAIVSITASVRRE